MLGCAICCRCFGLPMLRCAICCRYFGLEVVPGAKLYDFLPLLWSRSNAHDLLLLLWSRSDAPMRRYTICCFCSGLEVVPPNAKMYDLKPLFWSPRCPNAEMYDFVAAALVSKWCPNAKMYDLLPLLWFRSGAPLLLFTICCRCFGFEAVPQFEDVWFFAVALASKYFLNAMVYDLLLFLWFRSGGRILRRTIHRCFRFRSGAPMLRCTIWDGCFGFEVVPRPNVEIYDLLPLLWPRSRAPIQRCIDLLPSLWSRSGAPMLGCAICCRCFGLEVVPRYEDIRFVAVVVASKWCPNAEMYDLLLLLWLQLVPQC